MPAPQVRLQLIDAAELTEALTFISQWFAGPDRDELATSFGRFVGSDSYDLRTLRSLHGPPRWQRRRRTLRPHRACLTGWRGKR